MEVDTTHETPDARPLRTRRLRGSVRVVIVVVALALVSAGAVGAVSSPAWTPLFALAAFAGVGLMLLLRQATVILEPAHLVVQNLVRTYALPLAGIRRADRGRGRLRLVVYFHPDYPRWPGGILPHGWRARHRRDRLRHIRVFALAPDDELLADILARAAAARERIELAGGGGTES